MIVSLLLGCIVLITMYVGCQRLSGMAMIFVFSIATLGIALVVSPVLASRMAQVLGVGRGTDLILYVAVIGGLFCTAYFFVRMRRIERDLTKLAQMFALRDATTPSD